MRLSSSDSSLEDLKEQLAEIAHERWAHWQRYLHSKCSPTEDGGLKIPPDLVVRWERQMDTSYQELSEEERESDREQVEYYLPIIKRFFN